jgi:8-oxo-(d)GTP phosphatase
VILVRHGAAGEREDWDGDDRLRPLDARGRAQAQALVGALEGYEITRVVSSPFLRCVQTVEPVAVARGLSVELCAELHEARQADDGAALVRSLAGEPVLACVHGGLAEAAFGHEWSQKKGGVLLVGDGPSVLGRL